MKHGSLELNPFASYAESVSPEPPILLTSSRTRSITSGLNVKISSRGSADSASRVGRAAVRSVTPSNAATTAAMVRRKSFVTLASPHSDHARDGAPCGRRKPRREEQPACREQQHAQWRCPVAAATRPCVRSTDDALAASRLRGGRPARHRRSARRAGAWRGRNLHRVGLRRARARWRVRRRVFRHRCSRCDGSARRVRAYRRIRRRRRVIDARATVHLRVVHVVVNRVNALSSRNVSATPRMLKSAVPSFSHVNANWIKAPSPV